MNLKKNWKTTAFKKECKHFSMIIFFIVTQYQQKPFKKNSNSFTFSFISFIIIIIIKYLIINNNNNNFK